MIDLDRLEVLVSGKDTPNDIAEEMFVSAYRSAMDGTLLFVYLMEVGEVLDELDERALHLLILGFAMGQNDLETVELSLNDKNTKLH